MIKGSSLTHDICRWGLWGVIIAAAIVMGALIWLSEKNFYDKGKFIQIYLPTTRIIQMCVRSHSYI